MRLQISFRQSTVECTLTQCREQVRVEHFSRSQGSWRALETRSLLSIPYPRRIISEVLKPSVRPAACPYIPSICGIVREKARDKPKLPAPWRYPPPFPSNRVPKMPSVGSASARAYQDCTVAKQLAATVPRPDPTKGIDEGRNHRHGVSERKASKPACHTRDAVGASLKHHGTTDAKADAAHDTAHNHPAPVAAIDCLWSSRP